MQPISEVLSLIEVESISLETLVPPIAASPRPALPGRIAVVGNYLPRRCGIATFTTDLCDAIHAEYGATELLALPVNDTEEGYSYPARVRFELSEDNLASYRQAADFLNFSNIDLVCLQHEYGIFGGRAGAHILELLRRLTIPFVTTLHTVLREPDSDQRVVMEEITTLSDRLIVMSQQSSDILQATFHVSADAPKKPVGAEPRDACLNWLFRRLSNLRVPVRVHLPCSVCRNTLIRFQATALLSARPTNWQIDY